jgi:hypothetical protein
VKKEIAKRTQAKPSITLLLLLMRMGMIKLYSNENFPMDIVMELLYYPTRMSS